MWGRVGRRQCRTEALGATVLETVTEIFTGDPANYFILESQHALPLFLERVDTLSRVCGRGPWRGVAGKKHLPSPVA